MLDTISLLCLVVLTGAAGFAIGLRFAPSLPPYFDATNALQRAINDALIRGYRSALVGGYAQRHGYVERCLELDLAICTDEIKLLDASSLAELIGRGYETNQRHMHTLGWLAHSIGFDVRNYREGNS